MKIWDDRRVYKGLRRKSRVNYKRQGIGARQFIYEDPKTNGARPANQDMVYLYRVYVELTMDEELPSRTYLVCLHGLSSRSLKSMYRGG